MTAKIAMKAKYTKKTPMKKKIAVKAKIAMKKKIAMKAKIATKKRRTKYVTMKAFQKYVTVMAKMATKRDGNIKYIFEKQNAFGGELDAIETRLCTAEARVDNMTDTLTDLRLEEVD